MELTRKQQEGLNIAIQRFRSHERYTVISGYAGSGKSTLVRFIIEALDLPEDQVCFAAYTGKAAQVLLKKGNLNACTLHRLLYNSYPLPDGSFIRKPVPSLAPYKLIVVDEISMVPMSLMKQLAKYPVHVICLGDPFQIPPIFKDEDNHLLDHPHVFLDEIMRQAQESEIIRLTMAIREGRPIHKYKGKDVIVAEQKDLSTGMLKWADQVICATNAQKAILNEQMRQLRGIDDQNPQDGDKLICLRNYWDFYSEDNIEPFINGTIGYVKNSYNTFFKLPYWAGGQQISIFACDFLSDSGRNFKDLNIDKKMILQEKDSLDSKTKFILGKNPKTRHLIPLEFSYGYAITGHRAQGSQWENVLVREEKFPFSREEHRRWLYTCCTRPSSKLILIRE